MKLPTINNRELLPLRFIPFVLCFKPAPHCLVRLLTHEQSLAFPLFRPEDELFAYHLDSEGVPVRMNPREWGTLAEDMIILENQLRSEEEFEDEKYRTWRVEALKLLPARVFVWKDEFESVFQASFNRNGQIYSENANVGTNELIFNPLIEPQYHPLVQEGFEALRLKQSVVDAQPILINRVTTKMLSKIKVSLSDFIRLFDITDLENWQRGLRFEHDSIWIVATLKGSFFPEELASLNEHPVKDLNKPVLSFPCTLSQLEEFIKEQGLTGYIHPADWDSFVQSEIKNMKGNEMKNDDVPAKNANAKEIESLLKLVIAMAIKGYGFDPNQKRSPIPGDITSDVQRVGLSINEDTVRKWLKQGVELLPPDGNKKD